MENNQAQSFNQQPQAPQGPSKACKHCKSIIPKGAKVCPICHKKQGGIGKWIVIVLVAIIIISAFGSSSNDNQNADTPTTDAANTSNVDGLPDADSQEVAENNPEEKTSYSVGETAEQNNIKVTLVSVTESSGSQYLTPNDGNVFLVCEFEIENNSSSDIAISSIVSFEAYCDDYSITQDLVGLQVDEAKGKSQLDGSVAAGKKMNGVIAYQVPSNWNELEINFTPDFWSSKDITFVSTNQ